jgi:hypothetical protein
MAARTSTELDAIAKQLLARQPVSLNDESRGLSRDELCELVVSGRADLRSQIELAPDSAFEAQAAQAGQEVWSIGEIIGHCNTSAWNIGGRPLQLLDLELGDPPAALAAQSDVRLRSRAESLEAVGAFDVNAYFARIPTDADLEIESHNDFFGTMTPRAWLFFLAVHEADHIGQIGDLSA